MCRLRVKCKGVPEIRSCGSHLAYSPHTLNFGTLHPKSPTVSTESPKRFYHYTQSSDGMLVESDPAMEGIRSWANEVRIASPKPQVANTPMNLACRREYVLRKPRDKPPS